MARFVSITFPEEVSDSNVSCFLEIAEVSKARTGHPLKAADTGCTAGDSAPPLRTLPASRGSPRVLLSSKGACALGDMAAVGPMFFSTVTLWVATSVVVRSGTCLLNVADPTVQTVGDRGGSQPPGTKRLLAAN